MRNISTHRARPLFPTILFSLLAATLASAQDVEELTEQATKAAVARVAPSVVQIETVGGLERVGRVLVGTGPTTGLVVSEDGYVLSSAFNFIQRPSSILVTLPSGKRGSAEIVARDNSRMLVLLKVNVDEKLVVPEAVSRGELLVGQMAIAVGRTFDRSQPNISTGIISATNRIWSKAIQCDAKISPSNYGGPVVDLQGRVIGILVPMSPQGRGEVAGAEWYDSGIGFAVPLSEINQHLEQMKKGEDLYAGILGVSLKPGNMFADPAIIAAVPAKSPAAEAGLKVDDKIIELDGKKIVRQSHLKHALGPKYAGDVVKVAVLRGDKRIEASVELTDKLVPYEHAFLGVLPRRDSAEKGVVIRYVYDGSPADEAGIEVGDRLLTLGEKEIADAAAMQELIAAFEPKAEVKIKYQRDGEDKEVDLQLVAIPTEIPGSLPPAREFDPGEAENRPPVGVVEIKIPEEKNECVAFVPDNYHPDVAHGLLVWLHAPGGFDRGGVHAFQRFAQLGEIAAEAGAEGAVIGLQVEGDQLVRLSDEDEVFDIQFIDDNFGQLVA